MIDHRGSLATGAAEAQPQAAGRATIGRPHRRNASRE
jgi:hypothetical protein